MLHYDPWSIVLHPKLAFLLMQHWNITFSWGVFIIMIVLFIYENFSVLLWQVWDPHSECQQGSHRVRKFIWMPRSAHITAHSTVTRYSPASCCDSCHSIRMLRSSGITVYYSHFVGCSLVCTYAHIYCLRVNMAGCFPYFNTCCKCQVNPCHTT